MQVATRGDKPEWYVPPPGVTTATVCRLSGKLASEGCNDVEQMNRQGGIERRSMIYTEYFVRGTEPVDYCPIHGGSGTVPGALVSIDAPAPPQETRPSDRNEGVHHPVVTGGVVAATPPSPPPAQPPGQEPPTKRGFWGRIFGR